jgi:hypothetical protein
MPVPQPAISPHPTDEIARKRQALDAYASQGDFLVRFDSVEESFRPLPEYDYARPELWSLAVLHGGQAGVHCIRSLSEFAHRVGTRSWGVA